MRLIDSVEELRVPEVAPTDGEAIYHTDSGAEFTVDGTGLVTFTKTTGCLGCDLCWPTIQIEGKTAHHVNPTDVILCTKPTHQSTEAKN